MFLAAGCVSLYNFVIVAVASSLLTQKINAAWLFFSPPQKASVTSSVTANRVWNLTRTHRDAHKCPANRLFSNQAFDLILDIDLVVFHLGGICRVHITAPCSIYKERFQMSCKSVIYCKDINKCLCSRESLQLKIQYAMYTIVSLLS